MPAVCVFGGPVSSLSGKRGTRKALASLTGIWKERGTTDELMKLTRGEGICR